MTHVLVKHKVQDYTTWKKVFDDFSDTRKSGGEQSFHILHPESDPNDLTLVFKWDSTENAKKFMNSEELKNTMQRAGVAEAPTITFLNEAAKGTL